MIKKTHEAIYYGSIQEFILRCLLAAVALQIVGMSLFVVSPQVDALYSFFAYQFGVILGVVFSYLILNSIHDKNRSYVKYDNVTININLSEKKILLICLLLSLPLIPDVLTSLLYSAEHKDIRKFLLENQESKIINSKITMFFGVGLFILVSYYLVFVKNKSKKGILLALFFILLKSMLFMSRAEFVMLAIFYMLNRQRLFSFRMLVTGLLVVVFLGLYTVFVQGRTGNQDLDAFTRVIVYYSAYFGYPLYLTSSINEVFGEYSVLYSLFGYPVDVMETYLSSSGQLTTHLKHIATPSWVGFDIFEREHYWGNVLYPQYGFLSEKLGLIAVTLYYMIVTMLISFFGETARSTTFFWRTLAFIMIFHTARSAALGVPGTWFQIFFAAVFAFYLVKYSFKININRECKYIKSREYLNV